MFWPLAIQPILINVYKYTIQRRLRLNKNTCKYQMQFFAHSHNIHKQMTKFLSNVTKSASLLVAWGMMATWLFVSLLNMILRRISAWNTLRIWFGAHISLKSYGVALSEMSNRLLHRIKYRKKKTLRLCTKKTKWSLLEVCCCVGFDSRTQRVWSCAHGKNNIHHSHWCICSFACSEHFLCRIYSTATVSYLSSINTIYSRANMKAGQHMFAKRETTRPGFSSLEQVLSWNVLQSHNEIYQCSPVRNTKYVYSYYKYEWMNGKLMCCRIIYSFQNGFIFDDRLLPRLIYEPY